MKAIILLALLGLALSSNVRFRPVDYTTILPDDEFINGEQVGQIIGEKIGDGIGEAIGDLVGDDGFKRHVNGMAVAGDVIGGLKTAGDILGDIFGDDELSKAGRDIVGILKDIFLHNDELKRFTSMVWLLQVMLSVVSRLLVKSSSDIFGTDDQLVSKAGRDIVTYPPRTFSSVMTN